MSQYLSRFYCGNKDGLCNFTEPLKYEKVIDRQFDNLLTDIVNQCSNEGQEKGYCCDNSKINQNPITSNDLKNINKIAKGKIFNLDEKGNILSGQVPILEPNWQITVPSNPITAAADFALRLGGSILPVSTIPGSYFDPTINPGRPKKAPVIARLVESLTIFPYSSDPVNISIAAAAA